MYIADNNLNVAQKMEFLSVNYHRSLFFPQCLQKSSSMGGEGAPLKQNRTETYYKKVPKCTRSQRKVGTIVV